MSAAMLKKTKKSGKTGWKRYQTQKQDRKRVILGVLVLTGLLVLVFTSKFLGILGNLGRPLSPDNPAEKKTYHWGGSNAINVVVQSDKLYLLSYDPSSRALAILKIPTETYFNLPFGLGPSTASEIYLKGQSES